MNSKSCSDIGDVWPGDIPPPRWTCTCPPAKKCFQCNPTLWEWKSVVLVRRGALLTLEEREKSLSHASSEPAFHRINLLEEVAIVIEGPKNMKLWSRVEDLVNARAVQLYRIWHDLEDKLSLAEWVGEHFACDSVAVVWWTDVFFDQKYDSHAFDDLVGQDCSLWDALQSNLSLE